MSTFTCTTILHSVECPACHRTYAINAELRNQGDSWRCPYLDCPKSTLSWSRAEKSQEEILKEELAQKDKEIGYQKRNVEFYRTAHNEAQAEATHFRKSRDGIRGALIKTKKRIATGTCPCCNRHFPDSKLTRHIATKHPNYVCEVQP